MRDIFEFHPSDAYRNWLEENGILALVKTYVPLFLVHPTIQWQHERRWSAEEGGWHTTGDEWSSVTLSNGSKVWEQDYGNAVAYYASQYWVDLWVGDYWDWSVREWGAVKAARSVLANNGADYIGGDYATRLVELRGVEYFTQIASTETWIIFDPNFHPENPGFKPSEFQSNADVVARRYGLPHVQMWHCYTSQGTFWQHPDGSWWAHVPGDPGDPKPLKDVPELLRRSGGYYAPPTAPGYAEKRQRIADALNAHPARARWVDPDRLNEHLFAYKGNHPAGALEVVRSAIRAGEADVWNIAYAGWGEEEFFLDDPYFSSEIVPLAFLDYNSEIGLHVTKAKGQR